MAMKNEYTWDEVMSMQTPADRIKIKEMAAELQEDYRRMSRRQNGAVMQSEPADSVACCNHVGKVKQKLGILTPAKNAAVASGKNSKVGN